MESRGSGLIRRLATFVAVIVVALGLAGDRGRAASVPAPVYGQDPLEVLELKVRPNVIVVLDSSGSMTGTTDDVETQSGDHPRSKIYQAKQVIKQVVQNNQDKVSFQFGTYTQNSITLLNQTASATGNRFQYATTTAIGANLLVTAARGDTALGRGLQSWQIIKPEWRRLYFGEPTAPAAVCYAEVSGTPRFFQQGADLAAELTARMNAATCTTGSRSNTYLVTYVPATGLFTFHRQTGTKSFSIRWADTPYSIRGALGRRATGNTTAGTGDVSSAAPYRLLYRASTGNSGGGMTTPFTLSTTTGGVTTTFYQAAAGRLWNGEVIRVQADGTVCGMTGLSPAPTLTNPPTLTLQLVANNCGGDTAGSVATFTFAGASFDRATGGGDGCSGFRSKSSLIPCDLQSPPASTQVAQVAPYVENEFPFQASGLPVDLTTQGAAVGSPNYGVPDGVPDYVEYADGSWQVQAIDIAPSAKAGGYTPIANSLIDIKGAPDNTGACIVNAAPASGKLDSLTIASTFGACVERNFSKLWNQGQAGSTGMAGPAPWQLDPIKDHRDPKEKTIVLFVTDGDDTCGTRADGNNAANMDNNALRAAYAAQRLYARIDANEPASSVQTYAIGYGGAFSAGVPYRLNWIAWGGSGLGQGLTGQPAVGNDGTRWTDASATLTTKRAACTTCIDAFVAPDAATLATQLQSIIDQGASDGDFNAQQSITESVFEYVDIASGALTFDARSPSTRYQAIVPTRFVSSFSLPGFHGQLRAYQNDGPYLTPDPCDGSGQCKWSAGDKLWSKVSTAMSTCNTNAASGAANMCVFSQLHGGATDANIAGSTARIKRRIYSNDRNGVYAFTPATLIAGTAANRVALWPPPAAIAPTDYTTMGSLDKQLGLPDNTPTCTLLPAYANCTAQWTAQLQAKYKACQGSNVQAANCGSTTALTKLKAIRRESREMILAFMAGAAPVPATGGLARTSAAVGSSPVGSLLYQSRDWLLADSELATAAVVTFPSEDEPEATPYVAEYKLFKNGPRNAAGQNPDTAGTQIKQGFGLTLPDDDHTVQKGENDTRAALKPVMTVLYLPANDMLHAFRAGPNCTPAKSGCAETGGEELWGFVPYDQLGALGLRLANEPQGRNNHVFMLARGVRFGDVFVPGALTNVNIGGVTVASLNGVWRRILYFGRGIGGKYVTALDVTGPGAYTQTALNTLPPIPLWNRGNPDTQDGTVSGTVNNTAADQAAYSHMGETWSVPTLAYVNKDKTNPIYVTARRPAGIDFALFMGSGYGASGEGTTHYALDALSGDVIAAVDVETTAAANGLTRTGLSYPNALVANSVSYNRVISQSNVLSNKHPWSYESNRIYIGDLHGRLWKFLSARPDVAIPAADLGADQPVATAVALITRTDSDFDTKGPFIFVTAGADRRAAGPFRNFTFRDDGTDTSLTVTGTATDDGVTTFAPIAKQFARTFDQGLAEASCGYTAEALFRGTVQPTGTFECSTAITQGKCSGTTLWRVFFAGTRLSLPNTKFAPPTPLACSTGEYPCRSQFDSIVYALGAETGNPAYDLNASGDDAYRVFRDSRIAAIGMAADPDPNRAGSSFVADEGLMKGTPKAPPPPGIPPNAQTATANVIFVREPGQPEPTIHYGSSVCQQ